MNKNIRFISLTIMFVLFLLLIVVFVYGNHTKGNDNEKNISTVDTETSPQINNSTSSPTEPKIIKAENNESNLNTVVDTEQKSDDIEYESLNKKTVFYSPKKGDVFYHGETIKIDWDPSAIKGNQLALVSVSDYLDSSIYFYTISSLEDDVITKGFHEHTLTNHLTLYPGEYMVMVEDYGDKNQIFSEPFTIKSPIPFTYERSDTKPFIKDAKIEEREEGYVIKVKYHGDNDESLSSTDNWRAILNPVINNRIVSDIRMEGFYNINDGYWDFQLTDYTFNNYSKYELQIWCGNVSLNSACAQKYGHMQNNAIIKHIFIEKDQISIE